MQQRTIRKNYVDVFSLIMDAPEDRTPDEWANENRVLPVGSAEPGPMRMNRTPYIIPISRAFLLPNVQRISFMMARQMAKTNGVVFNVMGYRLDDDPVPIVYIGPTRDNIDDVIEPKIQEMVENCDSLWKKTARGQDNKKHSKRVAGVYLRLGWAGSSSQLKADAAGLVFVDEVDGIEADANSHGEGSTVDMAEAITGTYPEGKIGLTSTPTTGNIDTVVHEQTGIEHWDISLESISSAIWNHWQEGSRHEWAVPCPDCYGYFVPRFKLLTWPENATTNEIEETAWLTCPCCGSAIPDSRRGWMNDRGVMIAPGQKPLDYKPENGSLSTGGDGVQMIDYDDHEIVKNLSWGDFLLPSWAKTYASFWVSGLASFSSKKTYGFIAAKFVKATRSGKPERIQGVYNTDLGELFRIVGDAPKWDAVMQCAGQYTFGQVPSQVTTIVSGVDVQANRLVYVVRGFGPGFTSWLLDRGELWGDTDQPDVWQDLEKVLQTEHDGMSVLRMAVDSGYRKDNVYEFCRDHRPMALATKGRDQLDKPYYSVLIDVNHRGRLIKSGLQLWHVNSDLVKSWVHSHIDWEKEKIGAWFVPSEIDEDYCKQLVAESRMALPSGSVRWTQTAKDNHYLDAEALAYFAVRTIGVAPERQIKKEDKPVSQGDDYPMMSSDDPLLA